MAELGPFVEELGDLVRAWAAESAYSRPWLEATPPLGAEHVDENTHRVVLVASHGPVAYGEMWVDAEEDEVELAHLLVDPERRGRGLGVTLVRELSSRATRLARDVVVRVEPDNARALATYAAAGFVVLADDEQAVFNDGQPRTYVWMRLPRR